MAYESTQQARSTPPMAARTFENDPQIVAGTARPESRQVALELVAPQSSVKRVFL